MKTFGVLEINIAHVRPHEDILLSRVCVGRSGLVCSFRSIDRAFLSLFKTLGLAVVLLGRNERDCGLWPECRGVGLRSVNQIVERVHSLGLWGRSKVVASGSLGLWPYVKAFSWTGKR